VNETEERIIAVCGLDCTACPLRKASFDVEAAQCLVGWFRELGLVKKDEGASELMARGPYCQGCRGDRSVHWSADCWILKCCVDGKGLEYCYECESFPCEQLNEWAKEREDYAEALNRLRAMREGEAV
jgi:hypothetical protein